MRDTVNLLNPVLLPAYGIVGNRSYEETNHLGNVLAVISDVVYPVSSNSTDIDYYQVGIIQVADYSPFGVQLDGRTRSLGSIENYRFGFQGQEKDDEIKGPGNSLNYEYRMHDPRLGRFFMIDPLTSQYPHYSPYAFSGNRVIDAGELEGLEPTGKGKTLGESQLAKGPDGKIYTYTWENDPVEKVKQRWVKGAEYTQPTKEESALISDHVYRLLYNQYDPGGAAAQVEGTSYKLIKEYTSSTKSDGYKAGLYARCIDGVYFYVFATAGTDDALDALDDADLMAGFSTTSFNNSLDDAKRISSWVAKQNNGNNLSFTGHSLGGGLASANALATGRPATTFNAASIENVKDNYNLENKKAKINAYVVREEAVDHYQRNVIKIKAEGTIHYVSSNDTKIMSFDTFMIFSPDEWFRDIKGRIAYGHYVTNMRIQNHSMSNFLDIFGLK